MLKYDGKTPQTLTTHKYMRDMEPLEVAYIRDPCAGEYDGEIVMRTASSIKFEVLCISKPGKDSCWTGENILVVEPVKDEVISIQLFNK